tara:strand:+ start:56 stop:442 length:387 start_codon:yes stop_codon:yes gene_type:complete
MAKASEKYSDEVLRMADMMLDLNMTSRSRSDLLDTLDNMEKNDRRGYIELQSNIAAEQSIRDKMEKANKERNKKTMADKSGNPSSRDRSKNERAIKFPKKRPMNLSGQSRGGLTKTGSMDYRKKGMFY